MEMRFGEATWRQRSSAWLLGIFALLALALSATGIYAVMSQGVEQRRREIGVRLALGAARGDILRLIIGRVVGDRAAGIAIGLLVAVPTMPLLGALLYDVTPGDPSVFAVLAVDGARRDAPGGLHPRPPRDPSRPDDHVARGVSVVRTTAASKTYRRVRRSGENHMVFRSS